MRDEDEFYVGYAPTAPQATGRLLRRVVFGLLAVAVLLPVLLVWAQAPFAPATYEYGVERRFQGTIREQPIPLLEVARPGDVQGPLARVSSYPLVAGGKHGASPDVAGLAGRRVELAGSLVYRDGQTMIELVAGSIVPQAEASADPPPPAVDLGVLHLRGEIVDSKCHLGVMNPGQGKPHRDCAARCLSGGIPPALHVVGPAGEVRNFLLLGAQGEQIGRALLDRVAEPVEVVGRAQRVGDLLFLYADPAEIRRVAAES